MKMTEKDDLEKFTKVAKDLSLRTRSKITLHFKGELYQAI
jgi:hypothetical protein